MTRRHQLALIALAITAAACTREKPAADSTSAAQGLPAPGTVKAAPIPEADTTVLRKAADTKGAATKGLPAGVKAPDSILGRDSVIRGQKILGLPTIADTAKRKPD
jgi:hypothetical protein